MRNRHAPEPEFEVMVSRQERTFDEGTQKYDRGETVYDAR